MSYNRKWRETRMLILKRDDFTCAYCGQGASTVDHIVPLDHGGTDHETNLTAACANCNFSKKNKSAKEFIEKKYAKRFFDTPRHPQTPSMSLSPRNLGVFRQPENEEN